MGMLAIGHDITERKEVESALQKSEELFHSLIDVLDTSEVGVFVLDSDFRVVWVNQSIERIFGLRRDDIMGKDKRRLVNEKVKTIFEDPELFSKKVLATYNDNTYIENFECHVLSDGKHEECWLEHLSHPIQSGLYKGGRIEHYYNITKQKRAEAQVRASLQEKEVLLAEVHHRVKNNLQIISSLLDMKIMRTDDQQVIDFFEDARSKIYTMGLIHSQLYQSEQFGQIEMKRHIMELVDYLTQAYAGEKRITLVIEASGVYLSLNHAIPSPVFSL